MTAAYAVYAATPRQWERAQEAGFFGDWDTRGFTTSEVLQDNEKDWLDNLKGSPNVWPNELPGGVDLAAVTTQAVNLQGVEYEIRAISVAGDTLKPVKLERGRLPEGG